MAVDLTNNDISTRYALQEDFDNGFVGRDRQVVIQTDDPKGYRPVIMDGVTQGGKNKVALMDDLTDYATKTEVAAKADATHTHTTDQVTGLDDELSGKAASVHTHAITDITDLQNQLNGKAASNHTHAYLPTSGGTVSGNLTVTGAFNGGTIRATSDIRLKSEVAPYDVSLDTLHAYRYKLKKHNGYHIGLIAQDVQKIIPEAVDKDPSGYLSLDYNAIVALLVNKVNNLEKRISILEEGK